MIKQKTLRNKLCIFKKIIALTILDGLEIYLTKNWGL